MTQEESTALTIRELLDLPPTVDVMTAGRALGIGRTNAYALARSGQFPCQVLRAGRSMRVVTADLRRVLGIPASASEHAPAA